MKAMGTFPLVVVLLFVNVGCGGKKEAGAPRARKDVEMAAVGKPDALLPAEQPKSGDDGKAQPR